MTFELDDTNDLLWSTYQTVTVTAAEDANAESETTILRHQEDDATVRNGLVTVTVNDNDTPGVWLSETKLKITEGSTGTYDIALDYGADGNGDGDGERCLGRRNRESFAGELRSFYLE